MGGIYKCEGCGEMLHSDDAGCNESHSDKGGYLCDECEWERQCEEERRYLSGGWGCE